MMTRPLFLAARFVRGLLLLVVLLGAAGGFLRAEPATATAAPERVLREFYQWYMQALVAKKDPFESGRAQLKRYASERLIRTIDAARKSEGGIGADPFLDAQDFDEAWAKNITVSNSAVKGARATADVELKGKEFSRKLRIALVHEEGAWKVDKVEAK